MNTEVSDVEYERVRLAFNALDLNGNGKLDLGEVREVLRLLGLEAANQEVQHWFRQADRDGSKQIDFNEFIRVYYETKASSTCTLGQATDILKKRPLDRTSEEQLRLANYLAEGIPWFSGLDTSVLLDITSGLRVKQFKPGDALWPYDEEDAKDASTLSQQFYGILEGRVALFQAAPKTATTGVPSQSSRFLAASFVSRGAISRMESTASRYTMRPSDTGDSDADMMAGSAVHAPNHDATPSSGNALGSAGKLDQRMPPEMTPSRPGPGSTPTSSAPVLSPLSTSLDVQVRKASPEGGRRRVSIQIAGTTIQPSSPPGSLTRNRSRLGNAASECPGASVQVSSTGEPSVSSGNAHQRPTAAPSSLSAAGPLRAACGQDQSPDSMLHIDDDLQMQTPGDGMPQSNVHHTPEPLNDDDEPKMQRASACQDGQSAPTNIHPKMANIKAADDVREDAATPGNKDTVKKKPHITITLPDEQQHPQDFHVYVNHDSPEASHERELGGQKRARARWLAAVNAVRFYCRAAKIGARNTISRCQSTRSGRGSVMFAQRLNDIPKCNSIFLNGLKKSGWTSHVPCMRGVPGSIIKGLHGMLRPAPAHEDEEDDDDDDFCRPERSMISTSKSIHRRSFASGVSYNARQSMAGSPQPLNGGIGSRSHARLKSIAYRNMDLPPGLFKIATPSPKVGSTTPTTPHSPYQYGMPSSTPRTPRSPGFAARDDAVRSQGVSRLGRSAAWASLADIRHSEYFTASDSLSSICRPNLLYAGVLDAGMWLNERNLMSTYLSSVNRPEQDSNQANKPRLTAVAASFVTCVTFDAQLLQGIMHHRQQPPLLRTPGNTTAMHGVPAPTDTAARTTCIFTPARVLQVAALPAADRSACEQSVLMSYLYQIRAFHDLPYAQLSELADALHSCVYSIGELMYKQDDTADNLYVLVQGSVASFSQDRLTAPRAIRRLVSMFDRAKDDEDISSGGAGGTGTGTGDRHSRDDEEERRDVQERKALLAPGTPAKAAGLRARQAAMRLSAAQTVIDVTPGQELVAADVSTSRHTPVTEEHAQVAASIASFMIINHRGSQWQDGLNGQLALPQPIVPTFGVGGCRFSANGGVDGGASALPQFHQLESLESSLGSLRQLVSSGSLLGEQEVLASADAILLAQAASTDDDDLNGDLNRLLSPTAAPTASPKHPWLEFDSSSAGQARQQSVLALTDCHVLRIEAVVYLKCLAQWRQEQLAERLTFLRAVQCLKSLKPQVLTLIDSTLTFTTYKRGAILQQLGQRFQGLLIIKTGCLGVYHCATRTSTVVALEQHKVGAARAAAEANEHSMVAAARQGQPPPLNQNANAATTRPAAAGQLLGLPDAATSPLKASFVNRKSFKVQPLDTRSMASLSCSNSTFDLASPSRGWLSRSPVRCTSPSNMLKSPTLRTRTPYAASSTPSKWLPATGGYASNNMALTMSPVNVDAHASIASPSNNNRTRSWLSPSRPSNSNTTATKRRGASTKYNDSGVYSSEAVYVASPGELMFAAHAPLRCVALLHEGDVCGEDGLPSGQHQVSIVAETECSVALLPCHEMMLFEERGLTALIDVASKRLRTWLSRADQGPDTFTAPPCGDVNGPTSDHPLHVQRPTTPCDGHDVSCLRDCFTTHGMPSKSSTSAGGTQHVQYKTMCSTDHRNVATLASQGSPSAGGTSVTHETREVCDDSHQGARKPDDVQRDLESDSCSEAATPGDQDKGVVAACVHEQHTRHQDGAVSMDIQDMSATDAITSFNNPEAQPSCHQGDRHVRGWTDVCSAVGIAASVISSNTSASLLAQHDTFRRVSGSTGRQGTQQGPTAFVVTPRQVVNVLTGVSRGKGAPVCKVDDKVFVDMLNEMKRRAGRAMAIDGIQGKAVQGGCTTGQSGLCAQYDEPNTAASPLEDTTRIAVHQSGDSCTPLVMGYRRAGHKHGLRDAAAAMSGVMKSTPNAPTMVQQGLSCDMSCLMWC